jgi:hypothetical protein
VPCLRPRQTLHHQQHAVHARSMAEGGVGIGAGGICAADCIRKWLVRSIKCPVCVQPVVEGGGEEQEEEQQQEDLSHSEYESESEYGDVYFEYGSESTPSYAREGTHATSPPAADNQAREPQGSLVRYLPHLGCLSVIAWEKDAHATAIVYRSRLDMFSAMRASSDRSLLSRVFRTPRGVKFPH